MKKKVLVVVVVVDDEEEEILDVGKFKGVESEGSGAGVPVVVVSERVD